MKKSQIPNPKPQKITEIPISERLEHLYFGNLSLFGYVASLAFHCDQSWFLGDWDFRGCRFARLSPQGGSR